MNQHKTPQSTNYKPLSKPQYYPSVINQIPTVGNYVVVLLLAMIPLVGFILMIVWAVGGSNIPTWKSNYARAFFVMIAISIGIAILFSIVFGILLTSLFSNSFSDSYLW